MATVDQSKILNYLLDVRSKDGGPKAFFFLARGFTREAWPLFADALRSHGARRPVIDTRKTPFGTTFVVECGIDTPDGRNPRIRTVWITEQTKPPRLVTAYPR